MRDDFNIPNMGEAGQSYDKGYFNRLVRNIEMTFQTLKSRGLIRATTIEADTVEADNVVAPTATIDDISTYKVTVRRSASPTSQYYELGLSDGSGHFIKGFSAPGNAKPFIFDSTTNATNDVPSGGAVGYKFRALGVDRLSIDTDSVDFAVGASWGSTVASSPTDLTRHISIWGSQYGFNVTSGQLNYVATTNAKHVFIDNAGVEHMVVNNAADVLELPIGRIQFPATQNASTNANTLDDYEEGAFTPTITFSTNGNLAVTYTFNNGRYVKIGKSVSIWIGISTATFTHTTAAGEMRIAGLPFVIAATGSLQQTGGIEYQGLVFPAGASQVSPNLPQGVSYIRGIFNGTGAFTRTTLQPGNTTSGTNIVFMISMTYEAAA